VGARAAGRRRGEPLTAPSVLTWSDWCRFVCPLFGKVTYVRLRRPAVGRHPGILLPKLYEDLNELALNNAQAALEDEHNVGV